MRECIYIRREEEEEKRSWPESPIPTEKSFISPEVQRTYFAAAFHEDLETEAERMLGKQSAFITKVVDTWENVHKHVDAAAAVASEFRRMIDTQVWLEPEELRNIPDNSLVCRCKLLLSIKTFED